MTDDLAWKRKKAKELEEGNERSFRELNEKIAEYGGPGQSMDVTEMRLELLIDALKKNPAFEEIILDMEIECHTKIDEALTQHWAKLRESIKEFEKRKSGLAVVKNPTTLLGPGGQPLPKSGQ